MPIASLDDIRAKIGQLVGTSDWIEVGQDRISEFAEATEDRQFIHIDPLAAASHTPFGGTIAHGFLTLSLLSHLLAQAMKIQIGQKMSVNYGFNRLRFVAPVPAGSRIRARFTQAPPKLDFQGALSVRHHARELELIVNGSGPELLECLRKHNPESLSTEALTLEEIFVAALKK